ncbi:uncharacterized protein RHO25_010741 [Cercospora beticola]|uniref:Uncharacterized protein n=1 Tax=Cercospora beticola TaxID=122368 RepID=A0ABZ0P2L7_CERBT|nr:hypothetical protein RHO25_010741 [Cercospora beticola]CAK1365966.1 unnamed protein product [Cercospora beticola]
MQLRDHLLLGLFLTTASCGALPKIPVRYTALAAFYDGASTEAPEDAVRSAPLTHSEAVMAETRYLMEMERKHRAKGAAVLQHGDERSDWAGGSGSVEDSTLDELPKQALRT